MSTKVLIVGAGPVGLTVALQLARYGVAVDIIDKCSAPSSDSKALSVSAASLKAFHGLGLVEPLTRLGKPIQDIEISLNHQRCARIDKRHLGGLYDYYLSITQPHTESVLRAGLRAQGVEVQYGRELKRLGQNASGVNVQLVACAGQQIEVAHYAYVVGCDGAQSTVRERCGIAFDGYDYDAHFVMGDVFFEQQPHAASTSYHVHDDGFLIFLPMPGGLTRLVVSRPGPLPADRCAPGRQTLQGYLDRLHARGLVIKSVQWSSSARFFNRLACTNRQGRVFLAGDAFHLFSPIGGQGMNTGLQDAMNLSWKLAYFIRGLCTSELLDSYCTERYAAVEKVAALSELNTRAILGCSDARDFAMRYTASMGNRSFLRNALAQQFSGLTLDHSNDAQSLAGRHVPYLTHNIAHGSPAMSSTYDVPLRQKNVLYLAPHVCAVQANEWLARFGEVIELQPVMAADVHVLQQLHLDRHDVCLVRPDGYIGFSGTAQHCSGYLQNCYGNCPATRID